MTCDGSTRVWELAPSEVVALDGARGATLRVTRGRVWLTQHGDTRDIFLGAGDAFTIERGGRTVVEAQEAATLCVPARYIDPVRSRAARPSLAARMREWLGPVGATAVPQLGRDRARTRFTPSRT